MSPRRIPTKGELLRLQKLYRSDKRIAEILGGDVTEQLVAYWRRKKGIVRYTFPKFSEKDIQEAWDRFGDDFHAGLELGLSKAAFYNWRRRYKITRKPAALKLEQLSLELFTSEKVDHKRQGTGRQTIIQKILAHRLECKDVAIGTICEIEPDIAFGLHQVGEVIHSFQEMVTTYVWNPTRIMIALDGAEAGNDRETAAVLKNVRNFVRLQQIKGFFDIGEGDGLQAALERGLLLPGQLVVGNRADIASCGAIGAAAIPITAQEMATTWAKGKVAVTAPETVRIYITGRLPKGVFAGDVGQYIAAQLSHQECRGRMVEFYGAVIDQMSIMDRLVLCYLIMATGAAGTICPFDATIRRYITPRARRQFVPILADRNAIYKAEYTFDVNTMKPVVAGGEPLRARPIEELTGVPVQQIFLGGVTGGRFDDLKIAADILKGKHINPDIRLFIQPSSRSVYLDMVKKGLARVFIESGAVIISPGGFPGGGQIPPIGPGEKGLTTMPEDARIVSEGESYQVSPATAAASSLTGQITSPVNFIKL